MVKTRIVVLQMSQIIRTAIFAAIGLAVIIALIWFVMPRGGGGTLGEGYSPAHGALYNPGTYTAYIILHNQPVSVAITVSETAILDISLAEMSEAQEVFYPLFRPTLQDLAASIIRYQSTDIDSPPGAAVTASILLDAVNSALMQATVNQ